MRNHILSIILLYFAVTSAVAEPVIPDPDDWYKNQYAPTWQITPWEKVDVIAGFYAETLERHPPDGGLEVLVTPIWLEEEMDEWRGDGWISSELFNYESRRLNASTVTFQSKWLDRYSDGSEEYTCAWYLADFLDDRWVFTEYANIDCTE